MAHRSGSRRRSRRDDHEEDHGSHERWLVTYADMITLLMVLFIVLFAMSQVDQHKFNELRVGLAAGFGQSTSILDGSQAILSDPGTTEIPPIAPPKYLDVIPQINQVTGTPQSDQGAQSGDQQQAVQHKLSGRNPRADQQAFKAAQAEVTYLQRLQVRLISALKRRGYQYDVRTVIDGRGLVISLVSHHVVFPTQLATLTPRGKEVLDVIAPMLKRINDQLSIEGDCIGEVGPLHYPTDWELSAARAATVVKYLHRKKGIPVRRMEVVAWGHTKPLVPRSQPGSLQLNKRVDIVIHPSMLNQSSILLAQAAKDAVKAATNQQ